MRFFGDFLKNIEKPAAPKRDAQQTAHCHKKKGNDYNGYADCTKLKGAENYICPGSSNMRFPHHPNRGLARTWLIFCTIHDADTIFAKIDFSEKSVTKGKEVST